MKSLLKIIPAFVILISFFFFLGPKKTHAIRLDTGRSTIQGYVFHDKNQNKVLEYKTEFPGISGIRIRLENMDDPKFRVETFTDGRGYYQFYNIKGGSYIIKANLPGKPTNFKETQLGLPQHTLRTISFGVMFR